MFNFIDLTGHPSDALMTEKYDIHHDMDCKLQEKNTLTNVNNAIERISHPFLLYTKTYYEYRKKLDEKQQCITKHTIMWKKNNPSTTL